MKRSDIPRRIVLPFAASAGAGFRRTVPVPSQIGTVDGAASYTDGFPPLTFTDEAAGGIPPDGRDVNGLLFDTTGWSRWIAAGMLGVFDSAFVSAVGGYPNGAILLSTSAGTLWQSTADDNTTNPDAGGAANWVRLTTNPQSTPNSFVHPNGAIEQWGKVSFSTTAEPVVPVALSIPYSNAAYDIQLTPSINAPSNFKDSWQDVIESTVSTTGFSVQYQCPGQPPYSAPGVDGFRWRTIGY